MKKFWTGLFTAIQQRVTSTLNHYPLSVLCVFITGLMGAINFDKPNMEESWIARVVIFLAIMAVFALFTETYFPWNEWILQKKYVLPGIFLVLGVVVSFATQYLILNESIKLSGLSHEEFVELYTRWIGCLLGVLGLLSLYRMYKNSQDTFVNYGFRAFCSAIETTLVYGLFAIGLFLIFLIINALLFDTDDFVGRVEIVLCSAIYYPGLLFAFSNPKKEVGKFAKGIMKFVLTPMLLLSFLVVYLYIVKILIQWKLPSNEVFSILSAVFIVGLPVWTMTMSLKETMMGKISAFLPYVFIPFVFLQSVSLGLRIHQYGFTASRYWGLILLILEVGYLILYGIRRGKYVEYITFYAMMVFVLSLLCPGINQFAVVTHSLKQTLSQASEIYDFEALEEEQKDKISDAYRTITREGGFEGQVFLKNTLTEEQCNKIENIHNSYYQTDGKKYISRQVKSSAVPLGNYAYMYKFETRDYDDTEAADLKHLPISFDQNSDKSNRETLDLEAFFQEEYRRDPETKEDNRYINQPATVKLPNGDAVYICEYSAYTKQGDGEEGKYYSLNIQGYYFTNQLKEVD